MKKKFICTVCGYIYEGTEAPESCPVCHAPKSKFKEMDEVGDQPAFATVHTLGAARKEEANAEMIKDLPWRIHFSSSAKRLSNKAFWVASSSKRFSRYSIKL